MTSAFEKHEEDGKITQNIYFEDTIDIISFIENVPHYEYAWGEFEYLASRKDNFSFNGTKNFEEAVELCLSCNNKDFYEFLSMKDKLDNAFPIITPRREFMPSTYGFRPNIQKYLTSNPNSMFKLNRKEETKFITIYYNISVPHYVGKEDIINRGVILMAVIRLLESSGYRVELNFFNLSRNSGEYIYIVSNIKKQSQSLDPNICYFPMCHPSFGRRILFAVKERCHVENSRWRYGYGDCPDLYDVRKFLSLDEGSIIINMPSDLGIMGRNLYEDTVNFIRRINLNEYIFPGEELIYIPKENKFVLERKKA